MSELTLSRTTVARLWRQTNAAPNTEICGLIARASDGSESVHAVANAHPAPAHAFELSPRDQINAFKAMRGAGARLVAIYHSHPSGRAIPSHADRSGFGYPDAYTLILAPSAAGGRQIRAWRLGVDGFAEIPLTMYG